MATVAEVEARYIADTTRYVRNVRAATDATAQFAKALPQADQANQRVSASSVALGAAMAGVVALGFAQAAQMVKRYAMQGIEAAKQYEQTVISIQGIFAGTGMSMEAAASKTESYLADLRDFAAKTPFELPQTLDAVKRLLSIGYAADDVKDRMLPAIGDIVAALGQPPSAISGVVYAFGQMKSAGRVLSQDLMQIGNQLPGFNAKMALANELFAGDMGALTAAMEKGAVDSSKAIDVIIKAMTEFGGAAGAMDRQSKTLQGVISTFSDTVNNALIDGLIPSLPVLSATLNEVMPQVEGLATAFASALGPALIKGAEALGELAPTLTTVIPPIIAMAAEMTVLADVLVAMSPVLNVVANLVGAAATAIGALPAPLYAAVAAALVLRQAARKLGIELAMTSASGVRSFASLSTAAGMMTGKVVAGFRAMAVAAKGFMASIGPVGWAMMAAAAAFEIFSGKSANAEAWLSDLKASLDEVSGAFTDATKAAIVARLQMDLSGEDQMWLARQGIGLDKWASALMNGGAELDALRKKLEALHSVEDSKWGFTMAEEIGIMQSNLEGAVGYVEDAKAAQKALAYETELSGRALLEQGYAAASTSRVTLAYAYNAKLAATNSNLLKTAQEAIVAAGRKVISTFETLNALLDKDSAKTAVVKGWRDLSKAMGLSRGSLSRNTDEGAAAREEWVRQSKAIMAYAETIKNPEKRLAYLNKQQQKMRKELAASDKAMKQVKRKGKNGKTEMVDVEITVPGLSKKRINELMKPYEKAVDDARKAIGKAKTAVAVAEGQGMDVGVAFNQSMIDAIKAGQDPLSAAASAAVIAAAAAAKAALSTGLDPNALWTTKTGVGPDGKPLTSGALSKNTGGLSQGKAGPGSVTHQYNFYGGITADSPAEAVKQARLAARLKALDTAGAFS